MHSIPKAAGRLAVLSILLSCSTDATDAGNLAPSVGPSSASVGVPREPIHRLGKGLAVALADSEVRTWVHSAIRQSPYVEWRIPLREVLLKQGRADVVRKLLIASEFTAAEAKAVGALPELELYFPFPAHRAQWEGGSDIQVAVRVGETESFAIYGPTGGATTVGATTEPKVPTLVLGPSEIDYGDTESALRGGSRTGDGMLSTPAEFASLVPSSIFFNAAFGATAVDFTKNVAVYAFVIQKRNDDHFFGGDEIAIFGQLEPGARYNECARYNNITRVDYIYYQNTNLYTNVIATAAPSPGTSERLYVDMWEEDTGDCDGRGVRDVTLGYKYFAREELNYNRYFLRFGDPNVINRSQVAVPPVTR